MRGQDPLVLRDLLSLIAPPLCAVCGDPCEVETPVCPRCEAGITMGAPCPLTIPGVDRAWTAAPYEGVPRRLVAALKFGRRVALAGVAARAIAASAGDRELTGALVPVPADPWRRRLRGFDPALAIASELARELGSPLSTCLERSHGPRQVGRSRAERLAAGPRVCVVAEPPAEAVLVDDVVTTGATLSACAAALREAGAKEILAVTFVRA